MGMVKYVPGSFIMAKPYPLEMIFDPDSCCISIGVDLYWMKLEHCVRT